MEKYKTFKTKDGYVTCDMEATVKPNTNTFKEGFNGDCYYNTIYNQIGLTGDITPYDFKVIAAHPALKGIATYCALPKDDVEGLAENYAKGKYRKEDYAAFGYTLLVVDAMRHYKAGYTQAKSEGCFTKDDIMAWYKHVKTHTFEEAFAHLATLSKQPDWQFVPYTKFTTVYDENNVREYKWADTDILNVVDGKLQGHWEHFPPTTATIG